MTEPGKPETWTIEYLGDAPEAIPMLADWLFKEWGHQNPGDSVERRAGHLKERMGRAIPLALAAMENGRPIGTASLTFEDMTIRPELTPWMASVLVAPAARRRGVGSALVRRILAEAARLGVERLYLYTPDQERLYARLGWSVLERVFYENREVVVMTIRQGDPEV